MKRCGPRLECETGSALDLVEPEIRNTDPAVRPVVRQQHAALWAFGTAHFENIGEIGIEIDAQLKRGRFAAEIMDMDAYR